MECALCTNAGAGGGGKQYVWSYQYLDHVQLSHPQHTISPEQLKAYGISRSEFDAVTKKGGFKPDAIRARIKGSAEELTAGEQHAKFWSHILKD